MKAKNLKEAKILVENYEMISFQLELIETMKEDGSNYLTINMDNFHSIYIPMTDLIKSEQHQIKEIFKKKLKENQKALKNSLLELGVEID